MPNAFVSAHGGRWDDQGKDLKVPAGSAVVFYVADGEELSDEAGYAIFDELAAGNEPGTEGHVEEIKAGEKTYDYSCWYADHYPDKCGIFEVGTGTRLKDLSHYDEDNPLLLSAIFNEFPNRKIYWVACRTASPRDGKLANPAGSFLSAAG